ncbi:DUF4365 domain-containing protein [Paenibacillus sp. CECT 9249]|uniref:DUF4365 domain-containing protein n=1 Tax=Paenibacillus sp. CECT 9249 TaxID=2845385 RepID=UPI0025B7289F|nr:DUF4365 domain-containing protein [Paenibacillus sp. CECT 9249]
MSFDGSIEVYVNDSAKTESLPGSVPVQVKGTQVSTFSVGNRSFPLKLTHYQNYYKSGGALLLVVEINQEGPMFRRLWRCE